MQKMLAIRSKAFILWEFRAFSNFFRKFRQLSLKDSTLLILRILRLDSQESLIPFDPYVLKDFIDTCRIDITFPGLKNNTAFKF